MTSHLSQDELIAATDGDLDPRRRAHADACAECRLAVQDLGLLLRQVGGVDVPDPSPLFWDHFSRRVSEATAAVAPLPSTNSWRAWLSLCATAASVLLAVWLVRQPMPAAGTSAGPTVSLDAQANVGQDVEWTSVVAATGAFTDDELFAMADDDVGSFDELTSEERMAFVRLLSREMDVLQ